MLSADSQARVEAAVSGLRSALLSYDGTKLIDDRLIEWQSQMPRTPAGIDALREKAAFLKALHGLDFSSSFFDPSFTSTVQQGFIDIRRILLHPRFSVGLDSYGHRTVVDCDLSRGLRDSLGVVRTQYIEALRGFKRDVAGKHTLPLQDFDPRYVDMAGTAFSVVRAYHNGSIAGFNELDSRRREELFVQGLARGMAIVSNDPYLPEMSDQVSSRKDFLETFHDLPINVPVIISAHTDAYRFKPRVPCCRMRGLVLAD